QARQPGDVLLTRGHRQHCGDFTQLPLHRAARVEPPLIAKIEDKQREHRCDVDRSVGFQAGSNRANFARSVFVPTAAKRTTSFVSSSSASTLNTVPIPNCGWRTF